MTKKSIKVKARWMFVVIVSLLLTSQIQLFTIFQQDHSAQVKGRLIAKGDEDNSGSGSSNSGSSDDSSGSDHDEESESSSGNDSAENESETEIEQENETETRTEVKQNSQQTIIKFGEGEKIRTITKDDRSRIDVYSGGVKVRYEIRNNRVIVKVETEDGEEVEDENELAKIEDRLGDSQIKVATAGGQLLIAKNGVGALSNIPLQIDLETNELIANTSTGQRVLTVLPDQAVQNMLAANIISRLGSSAVSRAVQSGEISTVSQVVTLGELNDEPVYEIEGLQDQKLLGFIRVSIPVTLFVSTNTGDLVSQQKSLPSSILDFFSF